jgi:hypothetical protein
MVTFFSTQAGWSTKRLNYICAALVIAIASFCLRAHALLISLIN